MMAIAFLQNPGILPNMTTLFISDLHLSEKQPDITGWFLSFVDSISKQKDIDALYILGDFFDAWIGDDTKTPLADTIVTALQSLSRTTPLYFQHGNRDFLIGETFAKAAGLQLLPEEHVIDLYGTKTLLMHGDTLCTDDKAYMQFRTHVRNPAFIQQFLAKPIEERLAIAKQLREQSQQVTSETNPELMDVNQQAVLNVMNKYQVKHLIHGHTHKPTIETFHKDYERIVLAAWHKQGNYLSLSPEEKKLHYF